MFQVGGVDVNIHKYKGTETNGNLKDHTQIQDLLFLENRDRKYEQDIFTIRGHYQVQDIDFNLSQFGLFLQNDTIFLTVHINNSINALGRKIVPGDVIELPNLQEEYTFDPADLNNFATAIKKFYVVEEINRAASGFSVTWYPHLYRLKLKPIVDSQEYNDILDRPEDSDSYAGDYSASVEYQAGQVIKYQGLLYTCTAAVTGTAPPDAAYWQSYNSNSLRDILSTYQKNLDINQAVIAEAEQDAEKSGYETSHFYTLAVDPATGRAVVSNDMSENSTEAIPTRRGYQGYLLEDGVPLNSSASSTAGQFGFGIQFPDGPVVGDVFLRTDFLPNRLFRFDGIRWIKQEDNVRMTLTNTDTRQTQKTSFINNSEFSGINKIASDIILINELGQPEFESGKATVDFQVLSDGIYVLTNVDKSIVELVEIWVGEDAKITVPTQNFTDVAGKLAFTVDYKFNNNTSLRYSIYNRAVAQRQSLSQALKKIKPQADF